MAAANLHLKRVFNILLWSSVSAVAFASANAWAQDATNLGTVQATGSISGETQDVQSAPYQAPTKAPLNVTQPTSVISQQYIQNNVPLSGNYDNVVTIAPSVSGVSPNGPGLMENQGLSIRGFQDGQYNVTFDGIPWGDSNDFTHHSTSYFMAHDLGQISVDRGPGTAATTGYATFGGTIAIHSKDPLPTTQLTPYTTQGSFNTQLYGGEYDTGAITKYGNTTAFIDGEGLSSDGYLTHMGQQRQNAFVKIIHPINNDTVLTAVGMYNNLHQNVSVGATRAQIAEFGPNYGLNSNPGSQAFFGYNYDNIHTDFEYLGINSKLGEGWSVDSKIYTYAYYHEGFNGEDPNGEFPNGTVVGGTAQPNDVPGQILHMDYRSYGTITRIKKELPSFGDIQAGLWFDHQINSRALVEVDMSDGMAQNTDTNTGATNGVDRLIHQSLDTFEPYVQLDWKPLWLPGLTVSPGLKYARFQRNLNAQVNQGTGTPLQTSPVYDSVLPSMLIHYAINPNWSAYAQVAEGFLAPNENILQTTNLADSNVKPQQSWNYQIGTAWQTKRLSASVDAYYIDFSNEIGSKTVGGVKEFFNQGGTTYKGFEGEATYYVGYGVSLYGNGSINNATDNQSGQPIANTPDLTAAGGAIYNLHHWYGSLIDKWVGRRYGDTGKTQGLDPYSVLNAAVGYTYADGPKWVPPVKVKLEVDNLLDSKKIYGLAGYTAQDSTPLYWTIPGRSIFVTISLAL